MNGLASPLCIRYSRFTFVSSSLNQLEKTLMYPLVSQGEPHLSGLRTF
uniref:Uncharacterized protein n=1 Tax=Anguilla anguilla TaxID=7936 RepID=A0A0E9V1P9_ANGAN